MKKVKKDINKSVLFVGQAYYNAWYLSRELRKLGWTADVLNFDANKNHEMYYHGEDFVFEYGSKKDMKEHLKFFFDSICKYSIFHFSNKGGLYFLNDFDSKFVKEKNFKSKFISIIGIFILGFVCKWSPLRIRVFVKLLGYNLLFLLIFNRYLPERWDIKLLKMCGKKIIYSNNGCLDGVLKSSFSKWGPENVCKDYCIWYDRTDVCSDELNSAWGTLRNQLVDFQCTVGGNRVDYNDDPTVHEIPEFYCLDKDFWKPDILIPSNYRLPYGDNIIKIYHSVGNFDSRSSNVNNKNIKCTHIYIPLVEQLKREGYNVELIFFHDVPNKKLRYYQAQADILVDMLTFGFFGANVREAMMLGKPCICYLRPEWLESMRREIPEYVDDLPVISATPDTIYDVLKEMIVNHEKRIDIGRRSREFAVKWHSSENAAKKFDEIYSTLLKNNKK